MWNAATLALASPLLTTGLSRLNPPDKPLNPNHELTLAIVDVLAAPTQVDRSPTPFTHRRRGCACTPIDEPRPESDLLYSATPAAAARSPSAPDIEVPEYVSRDTLCRTFLSDEPEYFSYLVINQDGTYRAGLHHIAIPADHGTWTLNGSRIELREHQWSWLAWGPDFYCYDVLLYRGRLLLVRPSQRDDVMTNGPLLRECLVAEPNLAPQDVCLGPLERLWIR